MSPGRKSQSAAQKKSWREKRAWRVKQLKKGMRAAWADPEKREARMEKFRKTWSAKPKKPRKTTPGPKARADRIAWLEKTLERLTKRMNDCAALEDIVIQLTRLEAQIPEGLSMRNLPAVRALMSATLRRVGKYNDELRELRDQQAQEEK